MTFDSDPPALEPDPNYPSGPWTGFFLQPPLTGKHRMDLRLTFQNGDMTGDGGDWVGPFTLSGRYDVATGHCSWRKQYLAKHHVLYKGFNEGKGIWGVWEIPPPENAGQALRGGFHIWPEGMPDPTGDRRAEEADVPAEPELVSSDV